MSIKTRMQAFLGKEHRADGYTNAAIDALLSLALGTGGQPSGTAAVATAVQAISAPFGTCRVSGAPVPLSGSFMVDLVRRLMVGGNALYEIHVEPNGAISLLPASDYKISGSSRSPSYELEIPRPSGEPIKRRAASDGVVHVMINPTPGSPWRGRAPWQCANLSAEALAFIERSLRSDSSIPTGQLLPIPDAVSRTAKDSIANALSKGQGAISPIETTAGGYGGGGLAAPKGDYDQKRFGPLIPESSISMRDSTSLAILHSYGISGAILTGDGNAQLIARRSLFLDVIEPLARVVGEELSTKLDSTISLDFGPSQYRDHAHLSRAIKGYADVGLSLSTISTLVGLPLTPTTSAAAGRQAGDSVGQNHELANGDLYQFWIKRVCFGHGGAHGRAPLRNNPGLSCGF